MTATSTALAVRQASAALTLAQRTELFHQAGALIKARMFPEKFKNAEEAFMVALFGHELGLSPQRAWKQIHLIKGQPALEVHLQVAKVREAIPTLIWKIVEHTNDKCVLEHGRNAEDLQRTEYTVDEGRAAGLAWASGDKAKNRRDMLYARAAGRAVRWFYPETQGGGLLHNVEELRDALTPEHASGATVAAAAESEALRGDGRMPRRQDAVDVEVVEATATTATPPAAAETAAATADEIDENAVLDLVAQLQETTHAGELDSIYGKWREAHQDDPHTLMAGFDAKENRTRELHKAKS